MKNQVRALLSKALGQDVTITSTSSVGGGCINQAQTLNLSNGQRIFLKSNPSPPPQMFETEARGLNLLASAKDGPRVPKVIALDESTPASFLVMEYLEETSPEPDYFERFGRAFAELHRVTQKQYGLDHDNFIGSTPQINTEDADGIGFFRDQRLGFQQQLARKRNLLPTDTDKQLDDLRDRLAEFLDISGEQPALVHGDLWSGNHFAGPDGNPCIFDPAAHFGLRESDLAMTELFGRMPNAFYDAYQEAFPQNPGYAERKIIFNLYHLLNHLNLFGSSYLGSVQSAVRHFIR